MKFMCECGETTTREWLDVFQDEENVLTSAECTKCGKQYTKSYVLVGFEEVGE